jgi:outer membrane protein assembly factor BamE (lipoprotein component of BamABCDE complex)
VFVTDRIRFRTGAAFWTLAAVLALSLACTTTRGHEFDPDSIPKIKRDVTTQAEVQEWFGPPVGVRVNGSGRATWDYLYEENTRTDTGSITKVWRSISSIFRTRIFVPPGGVSYENTTRHSLTVDFGPDGVVRDFEYERTEVPVKRVY